MECSIMGRGIEGCAHRQKMRHGRLAASGAEVARRCLIRLTGILHFSPLDQI